jgi:hypothetical protein
MALDLAKSWLMTDHFSRIGRIVTELPEVTKLPEVNELPNLRFE